MRRPPSIVLSIGPYLFAIVLAVGAAAYVVVQRYQPNRQMLGLELVKALVQVATVLVFGQMISAIVKEREEEKERSAALTELRRDLLAQLSKAFIAVKRQRRLLRAHAVTPPYITGKESTMVVRREPYDDHMRSMNETELELESVWHQLQAVPERVKEREIVMRHVEVMKDYLRDLLKQYERMLPTFSNASRPLAEFSERPPAATLPDLIGPSKDSEFRSRFILEFRKATQALRSAMLTST